MTLCFCPDCDWHHPISIQISPSCNRVHLLMNTNTQWSCHFSSWTENAQRCTKTKPLCLCCTLKGQTCSEKCCMIQFQELLWFQLLPSRHFKFYLLIFFLKVFLGAVPAGASWDTVACCLGRAAEGLVLLDSTVHVLLPWVVKPEHIWENAHLYPLTPTCFRQILPQPGGNF